VATLSTGLVIAGAYAQKLRRALFAQLRDQIKVGNVDNSEVARAAGEINRIVYEIIVNKLRLDKGDAVRVRVDYTLKDGKIVWDLGSLRIEAFRRVPDNEVARAISDVIESGAGTPEYTVKRVGETPLGDVVFDIVENGKVIGKLVATPVDGELIVRGALVEPPARIEKTKVKAEGSVDTTVSANIRTLVQRATPISREDAEKIVRELEELLSS